jgi:hypothetical protein
MARVELGLSPDSSGKGFVIKRVLLDENLIRFEFSSFAVKILGQ